MVQGGGAGFEWGSRSKPAPSFESTGGRLRFLVELRPGQTTIVSWKKLLKVATSNQPNGTDLSVVGPSSEVQLTSQAPLPPSSEASSLKHTVVENEAKDSQAQAGSNRLNNAIERIERMYAGNGSGDEVDVVLNDVPDDDEYDTDDSFIDDTELKNIFKTPLVLLTSECETHIGRLMQCVSCSQIFIGRSLSFSKGIVLKSLSTWLILLMRTYYISKPAAKKEETQRFS